MVSVHPETMPREDHDRIVAALIEEHRAALGAARMEIAVYRDALERAGIEPPNRDGEDFLQMLRDAAAVISTASEFVHRLGTSRELLDHSWHENRGDPWKRFYARWAAA